MVRKYSSRNRALFTVFFVVALIAFASYYAFGHKMDVVVPSSEIGLDELTFNSSVFSLLGEAPFPPDQGLANGVSVEQDDGEVIRVFYPPEDDSVRSFQFELNSRVINVYIWKMDSADSARRTWETLFLVECSVLTRDMGRIKKADYSYAKVVRFGGKDQVLIWQKGNWVVLAKSPGFTMEREEEKKILTELFDPSIRN
ncbi:MAG: hypothetical protein PHD38_04075 [Mesotoga sp.]|jgi:hypothetical protein|uniref:hypothetical protein n=1 Tax=Mesotoga sp. TaxID=2053577 RepID=UPI0016BCBC06|nr:hypothetical protein [Mesotoga sp.]MDI9368440.1 hypothetical protein [Thermotogota bacterium]NLT44397.1 hypothetical protein [Thermotogaceae bacterium]MDD2333558.1 hypothetical protein [Mesotoga sp.]MDD3680839.1 hypothetical protein [Mesotoga sp.]MDD4207415.1 hypothetical protein [Mesotoga sp.]